jgi:hypothetical protein
MLPYGAFPPIDVRLDIEQFCSSSTPYCGR